jgi:aryl-alcohol dehydrogenase-like predicted oxidoreductase
MEYRTLGNTALRISAIGFGGAPIGLPGYLGAEDRDGPVFRRQAIEALRRAASLGVNYFDTAPGYGDGRSERVIGEALEDIRETVIIGTKFAYRPGQDDAARTRGLLASLDRLRTDYVDILQLHGSVWDDDGADSFLSSGALEWAESMRSDGLCRFIGLTAEGVSSGLDKLVRCGRFDVLQIAYSVIYQSACDYQRTPAGVIPLAKSFGMGVLAMRAATSDFLPRLLATAFPSIDQAAVSRLAIQFVLSTPEVDCAIVGMKYGGEVEANVELASDLSTRLDLQALHDRFR